MLSLVVYLWLGCSMVMTWTERTVPQEREFGWKIVNASDDGSVIMATVYFGDNYLSTDGGVTWAKAEPNPTVVGGVWNPNVSFYWWCNAVSGDGNVLVLGAYDAMDDADGNPIPNLYISTDKGVTWESVTLDAGNVSTSINDCCCDYDGSHIIAIDGDEGDAYLSTDSGDSFSKVTDGGSPVTFWKVAMSADASYIYAGGDTEHLYVSTDTGANWTSVYADAGVDVVENLYCSSDGATVLISLDGNLTQVQLSTNYGGDWAAKTCGGGATKYWHVAMSRDGTVMIAFSGDEVWLSTNGGTTWADQSLVDTYPTAAGFDSDGSKRFLLGDNVWEQVADVWGKTYPNEGDMSSWFAWAYRGGDSSETGKHQLIHSSSLYGRVYFSDDYGATWEDVSPFETRRGHDWRCCAISRSGVVCVVGSDSDRLYVSDDRGQTWLRCEPGSTTQGNWKDVAVNNTGSVIYAMTGDSNNYGLYKSINHGVSWTDISPTPKSGYAYYDYLACSDSGDVILAGMGVSELQLSIDGGESWEVVSTHQNGRPFVSRDGTRLAYFRNTLIYTSDNMGDSWTTLDYKSGLSASPSDEPWFCNGLDMSDNLATIVVSVNTLSPYYYSGFIVSEDYGVTWTDVSDAPETGWGKGWECMMMSGDGNNITVAEAYGTIYTSDDFLSEDVFSDIGLYPAVVIHGDPVDASGNALKNKTKVLCDWKLAFVQQYIDWPPDCIVEYRRIRVQPTSFWTAEKSVETSRPIELHKFTTDTHVWRYADAPNDVDYTGGGVVWYRGEVIDVSYKQTSRNGDRHAEIIIDPFADNFQYSGLSLRYERVCGTHIFSDLCTLDPDEFDMGYSDTGVLTGVSDLTRNK